MISQIICHYHPFFIYQYHLFYASKYLVQDYTHLGDPNCRKQIILPPQFDTKSPVGKYVVFRGRVVASNVWAATCEQRAVMVRATARVFDLRVANYGQREASDPEVLFNQICLINVPL